MDFSLGSLDSLIDEMTSGITDIGNQLNHASEGDNMMDPMQLLKVQKLAGEFQSMISLTSAIEKSVISTNENVIRNIV